MRLALICLVLMISCSNPLRKLEKETILKRMTSVTSFAGTYTERGIAASDEDTEIIYRSSPPAVLARVKTGNSKGNTLSYLGHTLCLYYPKSAFGIRYHNLSDLTATQQVEWIEGEYDWHIENYDIAQLEDGRIAELDTKGVLYSPNSRFSNSPFSFQWRAQVEPNYAFALQTIMLKDGNERYRIEYKSIEFQKPISDKEIAFRFPAGATVAEYDLAGKNYSLKEASALANFRLRLPIESPLFPLKKIIRAQGIIPAFTLVFETLPYQTYYTQVKDYGLNLVPERGLVLAGKNKRKYRINYAGAFRSVYFLESGVYHAVVSSRPLSDLLAWLEATDKP